MWWHRAAIGPGWGQEHKSCWEAPTGRKNGSHLCAHCVPGPGQAPSTHFLDTLNHMWSVQQLLLHITVEEWPGP